MIYTHSQWMENEQKKKKRWKSEKKSVFPAEKLLTVLYLITVMREIIKGQIFKLTLKVWDGCQIGPKNLLVVIIKQKNNFSSIKHNFKLEFKIKCIYNQL